MRRLLTLPGLMLGLLAAFADSPALALREALSIRVFSSKAWKQFALKLHGRKFLVDFYDAAREANMRPFLMWGTLLGCVRDGTFVAGDKDIDIGILSSDYSKKASLIAAMVRRGYRVGFDAPYKFRFSRPDLLHIDVDVFYPWQGEVICTTVRDGRPLYGARFPQGTFGRLRTVSFFDDLEVLIPDPPEAVLERIYGEWQNPDPTYDSKLDLANAFSLEAGQPLPKFGMLKEDDA